ncbi:hypothetical protein FUAX_52900 (plasmid) [Fulvitalea axinellae]|uniref:ParB/Sulfiredoxin domain-containing protein n=1 Tax=Fulvitalea axinellae TaxID=1182444 RepID=A0AAU9CY39_9BACT|nr:hypothetical protein FUAX_52900 [Fulvitalea axinellae]
MAKKNLLANYRQGKNHLVKKTDIPATLQVVEEEKDTLALGDIVVRPELRDFIPPLKEEEFGRLRANLLSEGVLEPLVLWRDGAESVLVDGHNRYRVLAEHPELKFKVHYKEFADQEEAKEWMILLQLGRRNLTAEQASYLRGLRYEAEKVKEGFKGNQHTDGGGEPQNEVQRNTAAYLAEVMKVSKATIERDAQYARSLNLVGRLNPEAKREILAGKARVTKGQLQKLSKYDLSDISLENAGAIPGLVKRLKEEEKARKERTRADMLREAKAELVAMVRALPDNAGKDDVKAVKVKLDDYVKVCKRS